MRSWDIFCRVVDNFGDVGVCWRLARQLASERGDRVRLWVDDLATLARIQPSLDADRARQKILGVEVCRWSAMWTVDAIPHDVVIEAFACDTPQPFIDRMASGVRKHAWINLEYLSAEMWIEDCHRLPSPHPTKPLVKHFYFPGFTRRSGGLLRERDLIARRDAYVANEVADEAARSDWWQQLGLPRPVDAIVVSMFAYPNDAAARLFDAWTRRPRPIVCVVPEGILSATFANVIGRAPVVGEAVSRGQLTTVAVPFVPQADYDHLLWNCDFNFVRGEDSFVRAQWAAKPFVWHIYPQSGNAHVPKLNAFVDRYTASMNFPRNEMVRSLFDAWNGEGDISAAWCDIEPLLDRWTLDARQWSDTLSSQPDLATQLTEFVETLL